MRLGTQTGSVNNWLMSGTRGQPIPTVGMGATILMWTDRHAATIIAVTPKFVTVQRDKAIRTDSDGMSECQGYRFERDPNAQKEVYGLRQNGAYVKSGTKSGSQLRIGERDEYYDYSF